MHMVVVTVCEQWAYYAECKAAVDQGVDIRLCPVHCAKSKAAPLETAAATASTTAASASRSSTDTAVAVHNAGSSDTTGTTAAASGATASVIDTVSAVTVDVSTISSAALSNSSSAALSNSSSSSSTEQLYKSQARVLLIGAGADEQVRAIVLSNVKFLSCCTFTCCSTVALHFNTLALLRPQSLVRGWALRLVRTKHTVLLHSM
jgi:hypothetical protein